VKRIVVDMDEVDRRLAARSGAMVSKFVDHLVFRVAELGRTERFYTALLGEPSYRTDDSVMYLSGETRLFFTLADGEAQKHEKENVGFNHIAFGVRTLEQLRATEGELNAAGIAHSGIAIDRYGQREFIWMDDPDGMRVEFYLRLESERTEFGS
jgi:glyoxylase I family protein